MSTTSNTGQISDGYHTFDELYHCRHILFIALANLFPQKAFKSRKHFDEEEKPMYDGMFVAGIETPEGQFGFHITEDYWDMLDVPEHPRAPSWDGYTTDDITRLLSLPALSTEVVTTEEAAIVVNVHMDGKDEVEPKDDAVDVNLTDAAREALGDDDNPEDEADAEEADDEDPDKLNEPELDALEEAKQTLESLKLDPTNIRAYTLSDLTERQRQLGKVKEVLGETVTLESNTYRSDVHGRMLYVAEHQELSITLENRLDTAKDWYKKNIQERLEKLTITESQLRKRTSLLLSATRAGSYDDSNIKLGANKVSGGLRISALTNMNFNSGNAFIGLTKDYSGVLNELCRGISSINNYSASEVFPSSANWSTDSSGKHRKEIFSGVIVRNGDDLKFVRVKDKVRTQVPALTSSEVEAVLEIILTKILTIKNSPKVNLKVLNKRFSKDDEFNSKNLRAAMSIYRRQYVVIRQMLRYCTASLNARSEVASL